MKDREMETFYIGHCECLHSGDITSADCMKRYLIVFDYKTLKEVKVVICNQFLRLKINHEMNNDKYYSDYFGVSNIIERLVAEKLHIDNIGYNWGSGTKAIDYRVHFPICERPYITQNIDFFEMTDRFINEDIKYCCFTRTMQEVYMNKLKEICKYYLKYAKYKKTHNECRKLIKKLNRPTSFSWKLEELTDLFNIILTLKINNYETSKQ